MTPVEIKRPFPARDTLAQRIMYEEALGGVSLVQWREGFPQMQWAEDIELKDAGFVSRMLGDAWMEGSDYHPTLLFKSHERAVTFQQWVAGL